MNVEDIVLAKSCSSIFDIFSLNSLKSFIFSNANLSDFGKTYILDGKISLYEFLESICLIESIIFSSWFVNITLLCFPISSIISVLASISLNSFIVSIEIFTTLSSPCIVISEIFPPSKCFLNNIQKLGATNGFSFWCVVKFILQLCESIQIFNAYFFPFKYNPNMIVFLSGSCILSILLPIIFCNSSTIAFVVIPSNAISFSSISFYIIAYFTNTVNYYFR